MSVNQYYISSGEPDKSIKLSGSTQVLRSMSIIVLAIFVLKLLTACSERFTETSDHAEFKVEREDVANYRVVIEVPDGQALSIYRRSPFTDESTEIAVNKGGVVIDETAVSGELYKYVMGSTNQKGEFHESYSSVVKIPLDIISSNTKELPKHFYIEKATTKETFETEIETMVLDKGFPFFTNGTRSHLKIKNLISNQGEIITFPESAKAAAGEAGQSGGPLNITVLDGSGDLRIVMRGQNGGDGIQPAPLGEDGRGPSGKDGKDGNQIEIFQPETNSGGFTKCLANPTDGTDGGKGKKGLKGQDGFPGGDSGELHLELSPNAKISYSVTKEVGIGGVGAPGGLGGPGGYGGKAGKIQYSDSGPIHSRMNFNCKKANNGKDGSSGEQGEPGTFGTSGKISKTCEKTIGELAESCEI